MKDILQDIIQHTQSLGIIDLVKIVGTTQETSIVSIAQDRSVIVLGKFKNPMAEFIGTFGMPTMNTLKSILNISGEYDENANIQLIKTSVNGVDVPTSIHFENSSGDFANDYRLMSKELVDDRVKTPIFKGATWNIDFEPSVHGISRMKMQASVHNTETKFTTKLVSTDLQVFFGDPSSHAGKFKFHSNITGTMTKSFSWPVKQFLSIMDLVGDKKIFISDAGVMKITVDSGLIDYEYLIPAQF